MVVRGKPSSRASGARQRERTFTFRRNSKLICIVTAGSVSDFSLENILLTTPIPHE